MIQTIGSVSDERADRIIARCLAARPSLTPYAIESDMIGILCLGSDDPDYFMSLLQAARRAQNGHRYVLTKPEGAKRLEGEAKDGNGS